jgi:amidase
MKKITSTNIKLENKRLSRRKVVSLFGLGLLATQFQFGCKNDLKVLSDLEKQNIHYLTLSEVAEHIKSKKITSEELTQLLLNRIKAIDGKLNGYITIMGKEALVQARALDKELAAGKYRGPLHGVPLGIKDLLYTTNAPTTASHKFNANFMATFNATVVDKLYNAGAVILGKLNLTEGAMCNYNNISKIPKNPWGEDLWTGVSSSGSGVATAAGLCYGSIGSDTGGSIRTPSVANGIVGLKPTYGLVSTYGVFPLSISLDHIGPMTRSTLDAAIMLEAIAGYDANDSNSLKQNKLDLTSSIKDGIKGLRIGIDHDFVNKDVDPKLAASIELATKKMEELGATVVQFKMPANRQERNQMWRVITSKEAYEANKKTYPSSKNDYSLGFGEFLEFGMNVTDVQYNNAIVFQQNFKAEFRKLLSEVDAFVSPAGGVAKGVTDKMWRANASEDVVFKFKNELDLDFGKPANLAGIPTLTMPCGKAEGGMPPPGFQLMGAALTEATLCKIGYAYEQATQWHLQHPEITI